METLADIEFRSSGLAWNVHDPTQRLQFGAHFIDLRVFFKVNQEKLSAIFVQQI